MKKFKDLKLGDKVYYAFADEIKSYPVTSIKKEDGFVKIEANYNINVSNINSTKINKAHVNLSEAKKTQIEEIKKELTNVTDKIKEYQEEINKCQDQLIKYTLSILESK